MEVSKYSLLADEATPGNGVVENRFEFVRRRRGPTLTIAMVERPVSGAV
jgi:hypothetical protein